MTDTELAAYLTSRICHDFASPLTSVCNGAELLDSGNEILRSQAGELVETGAAASLAWLGFVRYAFGSVGLQSGQADVSELRTVIERYFVSDRLQVAWDGPEEVSFLHARVGLNLGLIAASCLPVGGKLHIEGHDGVMVAGYSDTIRIPDFVTAGIGAQIPDDGWSARTIHPFFVARMCAEQNLLLTINQNASALFLAARPGS